MDDRMDVVTPTFTILGTKSSTFHANSICGGINQSNIFGKTFYANLLENSLISGLLSYFCVCMWCPKHGWLFHWFGCPIRVYSIISIYVYMYKVCTCTPIKVYNGYMYSVHDIP